MKKLGLSIIYPLWFFFGKTWFGNVLMIPVSLMPIPILISVIFPELMSTTGEGSQGIGTGLAILTLLCVPLTGGGFMMLSDYLENNYEKWSYKTEMKTKMI